MFPSLFDGSLDQGFSIHKSCQRYKIPKPVLSKFTLKRLMDFEWPGNVCELANKIERFVLLDDEQELLNIADNAATQLANQTEFVLPEQGLDWEAFEQNCLRQALTRHQGNRTKAAQLLGMSYKEFLYRLDKHGIN
jgi:DNA-binding NtrC family response regulator